MKRGPKGFVAPIRSGGQAELTLDDRGLPRRRTQVVHFAEGDMRVTETCARFDVDVSPHR